MHLVRILWERGGGGSVGCGSGRYFPADVVCPLGEAFPQQRLPRSSQQPQLTLRAEGDEGASVYQVVFTVQ